MTRGRTTRITPPAGLRLIAHELTRTELSERYGVAKSTIDCWCRDLGVSPAKANAFKMFHVPIVQAPRDTSPLGQAVEFLRRHGPVSRCNATGRHDPFGAYWRRGSAILTADEVFERAGQLGWRDDARCAA